MRQLVPLITYFTAATNSCSLTSLSYFSLLKLMRQKKAFHESKNPESTKSEDFPGAEILRINAKLQNLTISMMKLFPLFAYLHLIA